MKRLIFLLCALMVFLFQSCTSQTYIDTVSLNNLLSNRTFTFMAQKANPTNYEVINTIGSIPNSPSTRILNLDYGYTLILKNGEMSVDLPYFGRAYSTTRNTDRVGFHFTSKNFTVEESSGKDGKTIFIIKPKDVSYVQGINLEVFKNGKAYLSISANDRQPISYDGYLMKNEDFKK